MEEKKNERTPQAQRAAAKPAPKPTASGKKRPTARQKRRSRRAKRTLKVVRWALITLVVVVVAAILGLVVRDMMTPKGPTIIVAYEDLIRESAQREGLEPAYVASVVMAESSYRADALSGDNAQGLMQILPSTAEWIAGKLNETYLEGSLFVPEVNLRYGCWYLGWLMNRYGQDMTTASSAYFQGQGAVDQWLKDPTLSQDGTTLLKPATTATETYVNRILRYYEKYKEVYAQ